MTRSRIALALGSAAGVSTLLAANAAVAQSTVVDEVVVTAKQANRTEVSRSGSVGVLGDKAAEDVAFSIKSYNAALILNQQPQTLGQVLENDPSIRTTYGFGNAAEQFVIRGFTLFGDDVAFGGLYGITPRQLLAPELYDQVQVLNGASAFLNGAAPGGSGIGGSVNLMPKRAGDDPVTRVTGSLTASQHVGVSFDVGRRSDDGTFGLRINGALREGDVATEDEDRSAQVLGAALDWRLDRSRWALDVAYQQMEVEQLRPKVTIGTTTIPEVPEADANYGQPWTYTTLRDVFAKFGGEIDIGDNGVFYLSVGARDGSEDGIYGGISVANATTGDSSGSALYVPRTDNNEAGQAGVRFRLEGQRLSHELNTGFSVTQQVNRNAYDFLMGFATNLYDATPVPQPPSAFAGGNLNDPFPIGRTQLRSVFFSDTIGALDERLLVTLGARSQTIRVKSYSYFGGAQTSDYDESATTPVVGVVYKPADSGLSLFVNRIEGLVQGPTAPVDPLLVNPGQVFPPSESTQYEIGGKFPIGELRASLALYRTEQPSAFATPVNPANPSGPQVFALNGEQQNRGVEFSLDGELAPGLRIIAGLSLNDAELQRTAGGTSNGNSAVGVPDYLLNANVEWDLPALAAVTLTGRIVRTGEQYVNVTNTLKISDWTRLDLGARHVSTIGGNPMTLRFGIDNVTDERYWASAFDAFSAALLQGTPRTAKFSVSFAL